MKRYVLHEAFNIYQFEADVWQHPVHNHTYFEIIFILKGKGAHNINGNTFPYKRGDVFFLGPEDYHHFEITSPTSFCYIRFNESFSKSNNLDNDKHWQHTLRLLLHTSYQSKGSIVHDTHEKNKLYNLLTVLRAEYENNRDSHFEVMRDSLMKSIMTILSRNIQKQTLSASKYKPDSIEDILLYIRQHITKPERLTIEHVAQKFNYASTYLSIFFKRHTGESLKQYIVKHKLKMVETRLLYSQLTLSEIAYEFGYNDESHLCKQFRKYTGITPRSFRNKH